MDECGILIMFLPHINEKSAEKYGIDKLFNEIIDESSYGGRSPTTLRKFGQYFTLYIFTSADEDRNSSMDMIESTLQHTYEKINRLNVYYRDLTAEELGYFLSV